MNLKVSIVGYGSSAQYFHLPILKKMQNIQLQCVLDPSPQNQEQAIRDGFNASFGINDNLEPVSKENTDLAVICSPNSFHYEQILSLLNKGINVICEKPLCLTYEQVERVVKTAQDNNLVLQPFHNRRFDDDFLKLTQNIPYIGKIMQIDFSLYSWDLSHKYASENFYPKWRTQSNYGGGMFYDWMPHIIDKLLFLNNFQLPNYTSSILSANYWTKDCDDIVSINYYWSDKKLISRINLSSIDFSAKFLGDTNRVKVYGTNGTIVIKGNDENGYLHLYSNIHKEPITITYDNEPLKMGIFYKKVFECINTKKIEILPISFQEVLLIYELIHLSLQNSISNYD